MFMSWFESGSRSGQVQFANGLPISAGSGRMSHSETLSRLTVGDGTLSEGAIIMAPRIDVTKYPDALKAMYGLERIARERGIERKLLHLIKTRVSQINGCAYCIDMHTKDARAEGETEQRLYGLSAWRETPFYTPRERAALEWARSEERRVGKGCGERGVA